MNVDIKDFRELCTSPTKELYSSDHAISGIPIPKISRVELFSSEAWEEFIEEWASSKRADYFKCLRFGGAGDKGIDVVGFINNHTFEGGWDNFQCKHYSNPIAPSDIWIEVGKVVYYTFLKTYPTPRKYYFVGSKNVGTKLAFLLANPAKFKLDFESQWINHCETHLETGKEVKLEGNLKLHFDKFDFSIFSSLSIIDLINEHSRTQFHTVRFGGGLPPRPKPPNAPLQIAEQESRYIAHLFEAYGDNLKKDIKSYDDLSVYADLKEDFLRQRERFYHAESLRNFSRDNVPNGTFEELQDEIFQGIIDTYHCSYSDALERMRSTLAHSGKLSISSNLLSNITKIQDKQGICHQLANDDKLVWKKRNDR